MTEDLEFTAELHKPVNYTYYFTGRIYKDKEGRFPDGTLIRTSLIESLEDDVLTTKNSVYKLVWEDCQSE